MAIEIVTYSHKENPEGPRFSQYAISPLPFWAVNIERHYFDSHEEALDWIEEAVQYRHANTLH